MNPTPGASTSSPTASTSSPTARFYRLAEAARLEALADYGEPDADCLKQLQAVVVLAARLLHARASLVGLVGNDHVAVHGYQGGQEDGHRGPDGPASQGARVSPILGAGPLWETILAADPLFVWQGEPRADAGSLARLMPDAAVPSRFVAAPLVTPANAAIGALCISDPAPRSLSSDDRAAVTMLASQAMSLMELYRLAQREREIREAAAMQASRTRIAFSLAGLGEWRWSPATDLAVLSPQAAQILGLPAQQPISRDALCQRIAPEHREQVRLQFENAIRERRSYYREFRLRHPDGRDVWVQTQGAGVHDEAGRVIEVVGIAHDITARRLAEAQLRIREDRAWMKAELINRVQDLDDPGDVAMHAIAVVVERLGLGGGGLCRVRDDGHLEPLPERTLGDAGDIHAGIGLDHLDTALLRRLVAGPVEIELGTGRPDGNPEGAIAGGPRPALGQAGRSAQLCALLRHGRPAALFWFISERRRGWRDGEAQAIQSIVDLAYAYYGRAQARRSAKAGERRLLLVAEWMPQLAWLARADGQTVWFNQRWLAYSGLPIDELIGGGWLALCHPADRQRVEDDFRRGMAAEQGGWETTLRLRRADGQYRWHLSRALPFSSTSDDEPLLWFGTMVDVTEQHRQAERREALLESARLGREEAEGANRLKDEFLATLSHELRTPLTAMLGWSQVLRRTVHDPELVRQGVEIIERNAQIQSQIVDDLLDMSAIASGTLRLEAETLALAPLVGSVIEAVKPKADARQIRLLFDDGGQAVHVEVDAARIRQVLDNLLTNAIKFSPPRSVVRVSLSVRHSGWGGRPAGAGAAGASGSAGAGVAGSSGSAGAGRPAAANQAVLSVSDQGIGMTADFLPHVFERFRQADGSNTRLHGGLGLGLAIVRQLIEMHGGGIEASSAGLGKGATFVFHLPLALPVREQG